ncbi:histone-lysine N-methyltransferase SETMAR [Trichonephila inaurata madagascariensis]|uniref:Histone-lysine N-methyltransferase SETMAR n=1 Tax=Trichonephila inaurata madagascariensis TaxID=2747483 RepID=A0A8X6XN69_9ARAC|nr:histone-lysine N-methyltransferase SETMAR [Trichonephila inaurata madagascariensis]
MPWEALTGIGSCAGACMRWREKALIKAASNDAAGRMRTGWRSRCKIRRLRNEVLIRFRQRKGENRQLFIQMVHQEQKTGAAHGGWVLLHDNAHPQISRVTQMELDKFKWETLDYPPYSTDMSPCDFHVFGPLKKHLKGKRFNSDDVLKDTVKDWVSSQPQEFWEQGIMRLVYPWDRCVQAYGVYFE